jgi:beta-glucosidase
MHGAGFERIGAQEQGRLMANFMFCAGIENSIRTINNGRTRIDQMDVCGHYKRWRDDFDLVEDLGMRYLRFGPPIHRTLLGPGTCDWEFVDLTLGDLKARDITPIVDLCHFGVPDWLGNFQNPDFPEQFAQYAAAFATRYH